MYKDLKYALDGVFIFVFSLTIILFLIEFKIEINPSIMSAMETIDYAVFGGYYAFFGYEFFQTKKKFEYCKKHWLLMIFFSLPFLPVTRLMQFARLERLFYIGVDTVWHILDELEIL